MSTVYTTLGVFVVLTVLFHIILKFTWSGNFIFWKLVDYFSVLSSAVAIAFAVFSGHIQDKKTQLQYLERDILSSSIILLHAPKASKILDDDQFSELSHILDHMGQYQLDDEQDFSRNSDRLKHIKIDTLCKNAPIPSGDAFETAVTLEFLCSSLNRSVETSEYIEEMGLMAVIVKFWNIILALGASLAIVKITSKTESQ